jgi:hypothetical protein
MNRLIPAVVAVAAALGCVEALDAQEPQAPHVAPPANGKFAPGGLPGMPSSSLPAPGTMIQPGGGTAPSTAPTGPGFAPAPMPGLTPDTGAGAGQPAPPMLGDMVAPGLEGPGAFGAGTPALDAANAPAVANAGAGAAGYSGLGGTLSGADGGLLQMLGDAPPINTLASLRLQAVTPTPPLPPTIPPPTDPPVPGRPRFERTDAAALVPSVRGFKVSENQSPVPQDRIYFSFNYYDNLNADINRRLNSPLYDMNVYRYFFGIEKTFWDGDASIQLRVPIDNLTTKSYVPGFGGSSTSVGDLATILKYAFYRDRDTGNLFSGGLLVQAPTGPNQFAGFPNIRSPHSAAIQPFLGFVWNSGNFYFHGFSSIDVPFSKTADVTVWFNDLGVGYFLYRTNDESRFLRLLAPTFEIHANTPVNNSDPFDFNALAGTPQLTNLTFGLNAGLGRRGMLAVGYVNPITGPRAFNGEVLAQFNLRY